MQFDSNLAWRQASATVSANRDVVLAMAGVFFLLPRLIFTLLMPETPIAQGATPEEIAAQIQTYYIQILPWVIPQVLFQAVGSLSLLTLFTDRTRPTVGEAIRIGAKGVFPYLLAQILFGIAVALIGGIALGLAALSQQTMLVAAVGVAVAAGFVVGYTRIALTAPAITVEHLYNPLHALRRSWELTRGNTLRILTFLMLVILVAVVAMWAAVAISGALAAVLGGKDAARIAAAAITSIIAALLALYMTAILAAIHRQLAGPGLADISATFE